MARSARRPSTSRPAGSRPSAARASAATPRPLGSAPGYRWMVDADHVDMSRPHPEPRRLTIPAAPQTVTVDLGRTAMIVIDMQNDFCAKGGWVDYLGVDFTPIELRSPRWRLLPALRAAGRAVIWVNWGNRPDLMNMAPNQLHLYNPRVKASALAIPCPGAGRVCWRRTAGRPRWSTS